MTHPAVAVGVEELFRKSHDTIKSQGIYGLGRNEGELWSFHGQNRGGGSLVVGEEGRRGKLVRTK